MTSLLPPLRQSMVETAACPRAYVEIYINGKAQPETVPSERGSEVHQIMAEYIRHCAGLGIAADWVRFNQLAIAAGPEAGPILDGIRDSYEVDHARVYGTEITLRLSDRRGGELLPCAPPVEFGVQNYVPHEDDATCTGTLDVLLLNQDGTHAKIEDFKTHAAPFDADTFQGTLYPFLVFKHLAQVQVITFELIFVRYPNCRRSVQWRRAEMPEMQAVLSRARERQRLVHERPDQAKVLPGKTCAYCPLAKDFSCPIAEWNEYTTLTPADRLRWKVWMSKMGESNTRTLRSFAEVRGPVRYEDGNGRVYEYGPQEVPETRIPLDETTLHLLRQHKTATGEDLLDGRLNVSSTKLKSLLSAKKRTPLREVFEESVYQTSTKVKLAIRTPEGVETEFNPYAEE